LTPSPSARSRFEPPPSSKNRFGAALSAAAFSGLACLATLIEPRWLGFLVDEDSGDASQEILAAIVVLFCACLLFGLTAWREWRRQREAARAVAVEDLA
jgi:hypothetical protein